LRTPPEPLVGVPLTVDLGDLELVDKTMALRGNLALHNQSGRPISVDRVEWSIQTGGDGQVGLADGLVVAPATSGVVPLNLEIQPALGAAVRDSRAEVAGTVYWKTGWRNETTVFHQTVAVTGIEPVHPIETDDSAEHEGE